MSAVDPLKAVAKEPVNITLNVVPSSQSPRPPLWQRILKRPFHYYFRGASLGFGLTFLGNFAVGLVNGDDQKNAITLYQNPQTFTFMNFRKSLQHGLLWPAIPFAIIRSPRDFFVVGESVNKVNRWIEENNQ